MKKVSAFFRFATLLLAFGMIFSISLQAIAFAAPAPCPANMMQDAGNDRAAPSGDQSMPCDHAALDCMLCAFCVASIAIVPPQSSGAFAALTEQHFWPTRTDETSLSHRPALPPPIALI